MSCTCPVCKSEITALGDQRPVPEGSGGTETKYPCSRCGDFWLRDDFGADALKRTLQDDPQKIGALSHWIRTRHESMMNRHRKEPTVLTEGLITDIIRDSRPLLPEQEATFIRWIGDSTIVGGEYVLVKELPILAIVGSATAREFDLLFRHLEESKLIHKIPECGKGERVLGRVSLTYAGWERYEEIKRGRTDSRKAFMAMEYANSELTDIFTSVFQNAATKTGFDLRRLVDTPQPAGLIDDDLRVKIRASRFLIADLTDRNPGAYWEAGYAEGLGKPVIYTCRKEVFENSKSCPHFDTNHHLTILWEWDPDKRKEVGEKLKATIRATLPAEARLADD